MKLNKIRKIVVDFWYAYYTKEHHCSLCGNSGVIDTTGIKTPAGLVVGDKHYCICPNGQCIRFGKHYDIEEDNAE